jgi:hypothetical protein
VKRNCSVLDQCVNYVPGSNCCPVRSVASHSRGRLCYDISGTAIRFSLDPQAI